MFRKIGFGGFGGFGACLALLVAIVVVPARAETWRTYENGRFGSTIDYPDRFVAGKPPENGDGLSFSSADGSSFSVWGSHNSLDHNLAEQEAFFRKILQGDGAIISYRASRDNWFVLSGTQGDKTFYVRELLSNRNTLIHGFKIVYPSKLDKAYDSIVTRMSHSLRDSPNALEVQTRETAETAQPINVEREMRMLRKYFGNQSGPALLSAQSLLVTYGAYQGTPDGKWSETTESAFRRLLEMYIAIGGRGVDWGINKPADTKRFLEWVAAAAYANKNGTEFPD